MSKVVIFFAIMILAHLYFVPAIIAGRKGHRNYRYIFNINLFFGFTIIGWFIALALALKPADK